MVRLRFLYQKRRRAVFISHVELPPIFARAARRAGMTPRYTEGFSPKPKLSLGPALPVGVVGLAEPVEIWLESWSREAMGRMSDELPSGLMITDYNEVDGAALNKRCRLAEYLLAPFSAEAMAAMRRLFQAEGVPWKGCSAWQERGGAFRMLVNDPQRSVSSLVKALGERGVIAGWEDLAILRMAVGEDGGDHVCPLVITRNDRYGIE
ncbi:MAG: TIGR03936 family radical SAM-associated protein [Synergistales bacterium]|nr:TIGR03936 family radical SAM-associated protein [Synergistales bacterium]